MPPTTSRDGIFWAGVNDRITDLFEGLWPVAPGRVSYNADLVRGERAAVVDLATAIKVDEFLDPVAAGAEPRALEFVVINHMEPGHSGLVRTLPRIAPQVTRMGSEKTVALLDPFYGIRRNVRAAANGEALSLGNRSLRLFPTPLVHWPGTMMTLEESERVLFSCDAFGGYGALRGGAFDDQCPNLGAYEAEALRYDANIVAGLSPMGLTAIAQLAAVPVEVIAPSHGLIWRKSPHRIVELYERWARYAQGPGDLGLTLLCRSMYGNSEKVMNAVAKGASAEGVPVEIFDVTRAHVLDMAGRKAVRAKKVARFGSYGWSGGARGELERWFETLRWDQVLEPLEFVGAPSDAELEQGERFGRSFGKALRKAASPSPHEGGGTP
ncbi:MAG: FprA family A-type flavoprotein [Deferrisomatales bacterium]